MDNNSRLKVGDIVQHFKREFLRGSWFIQQIPL